MEEINKLHETKIEWGVVCKLIDKIGDIEETIDGHWDDLLDMVMDIVDEGSKGKDSTSIFFEIYSFVFRLYYRLRANPQKRDFNQVSKLNFNGEEVFRITNYDFKTFKWVQGLGITARICNDYIDLPTNKLTTAQQRGLERRIKENYAT